MQREQYEQAETAFELAMQQGADRKKCLMGMGMAAMGRAYTQGAWERFLQVLTDHPDDAEAIHWLLRAGTAQNRWQELSEHLHLYTARNPADLAARFAFTSILFRGEQIEGARREYDALCKVDPSYDGLAQLGQAIAGRKRPLPWKPPRPSSMTQRVLVIQLARLGDLVQTSPAVTALKDAHAGGRLIFCALHAEDIGRALPGISTVVTWDGAGWKQRALQAEKEFRPEYLVEADTDIRAIVKEPYDCAFVLNQHPRAILAGALLARDSMGAISGGPLDHKLSPWATYVRSVASDKGDNRVHLADAFCGMCGVAPPKEKMPLQVLSAPLPRS